MSTLVVKGNAIGSGTITVEGPNTNSNFTVSIPAATTTLIGTDTTDVLTNKSIAATQLTGTIAAARLPAGSVLQVVQGVTTTQAVSTSTTWSASNLTVSITPTNASSKIAVFVSGGMNGFAGGGASDENMGLKIYRKIGSGSFAEVESSSRGQQAIYVSANIYSGLSINYLDSPSTTSTVTYTLYFRRENGSGTASVNRDSNNQTQIITMEIAG